MTRLLTKSKEKRTSITVFFICFLFLSETNAIEFTPTGRYIYAFCVTEFRAGEVLSQYRYNIFAQRQFSTSSEELQDEIKNHQVWHSDDKKAIVITAKNLVEEANISVYSIDGKMINQSIIYNQTQSLIPSEGWSLVIYFISIGNDKFSEIHKVYVK